MNRVVIITGSTRGIGLATVAKVLINGDRLVIFCRHREHVLKAKEQQSRHGPLRIINTGIMWPKGYLKLQKAKENRALSLKSILKEPGFCGQAG